ncbi:hypothetical protein PR048_021876 [Dryococelus australis]|uniref:Zinc finger BED domain-containing protein 4 n=1 Tax=Dryococelus australis TaxID=614101 RepID=A0ABQ9GZJ3_9NEOP|nr:hypothetical protein PR048_021876 [Dryococelus australis]
MRKKRSKLWLYFKEENDSTECLHCAKHLKTQAVESKALLCLTDAKKETYNVNQLLSKCRPIVAHYNRSSVARGRLLKVRQNMDLPQLKVIQDMETHWSTEYAMLDRLVSLREAVAVELSSSDVDSLSPSEWKLASGLVEVMKPFADAMKECCGNN